MRILLVRWLPPILWGCFIFYMSSQVSLPVTGPGWFDFALKKIAHMTEYGIFFLLWYRALSDRLGKRARAVVSFLIIILYAASDEFHQSFVPTRHPNIEDVGFDSLGGIIAWITVWNILPKMPKKLRNWANRWDLC